MAKKTKKAKSPKTPKGRGANRGGKDPVTGIALDIQGVGRIESDTVYDSSSEQIKGLYTLIPALRGYGEMQVELEYSPNAIILNTLGKTSRDGARAESDYFNRHVFFGKFMPTTGAKTDFIVDRYYHGHAYTGIRRWEGSEGPVEYLDVSDSRKFTLSSNLGKTFFNFPPPESFRVLFATNQDPQNARVLPSELSTLFPAGWDSRDNFFASNLI